ncbi:MAG: hypothetical protein Q9168_000106 [Polycauliona sp. 1 TL-2023]
MAPLDLLISATAGALSHLVYFNRGEHHLYGTTYLLVYSLIWTISAIALNQGGASVDEAVARVTVCMFSYFVGLYSSLMLYRSIFHPLNKFPGPFAARLSKFWLSAHVKNRAAFRTIHRLHEEYGDFVRVGPSDLSVAHPSATNAIYGPASKTTKATWYDLTLPMGENHVMFHIGPPTYMLQVDMADHDQRRRLWSAAFSDKALRGYETRILKYRRKLLSQIGASGDQPMDVSKWFNLYTYDTMGDLAFGTSFKMLDASEQHWAIKLLIEGLEPHSWLFPVWFLRVAGAVPGAMDNWFKALAYCHQMVEKRMTEKVEIPDIMSTLLEPLQGRKPTEQELNAFHGDSQLVIIAGSDTTATTLSCSVLELARNPDHVMKLRKELGPYMQDRTKDVANQDIAKLDHLNGVIYEALRLYPPVPSAVERKTPPEGMEIGGQFIPGNMTIWCSAYVTGRKEEIYTKANAFVPERWYLHPEMVKDKSAWAPFSAGTDPRLLSF